MARRFPVAILALYGQILTDADGKTLYTLSSDGLDASNCSEACAAAWPPLLVDTSMMDSMMDMSADTMEMMMMSGPLGGITRGDVEPHAALHQSVRQPRRATAARYRLR
ncbi:MAG: hypothetical protein HW416_1568 [Chloroflexi bacterium]|nr:hypothetical protein [Chloroflexota bacterium]